MTQPRSSRPGTTLIELLIYLALMAVIASILLPLLFMSSEDRLLQQTESLVEQNGTQLLQAIMYQARHAEKILDPLTGSTGAVLTLQTGSGTTDPTIVGISSGSLVLIQRATKEVLSSPQVAVEDFVVRNTSISDTRQSLSVKFRLSRTIRLQAPRSYSRYFETTVTLLPDDERQGDSCGCASPGCSSSTYYWEICTSGACQTVDTPMECP